SSSPNNIRVSNFNSSLGYSYLNAIGPTLQPAISFATLGQLLYVPKLPSGGFESVTVTFSAAPTFSNCVLLEYSGADPLYPLDTVSTSYSSAPSALLDSGDMLPANSNLLVVAAAVADQNIPMTAGNGFTKLQASNYGTGPNPGTGIVESTTASITGNNMLQRATACIGMTLPCPPGGTSGDWLMQVAIFRDTPPTVSGGW